MSNSKLIFDSIEKQRDHTKSCKLHVTLTLIRQKQTINSIDLQLILLPIKYSYNQETLPKQCLI